MIIQRVLVSTLLLCLANCSFIYDTPITVGADVMDIEFSPSQTLLAVAGKNSLGMFNGVTGQPLLKIEYQNTEFADFSFAQDDNTFILGLQNGSINIYRLAADEKFYISSIDETLLQLQDVAQIRALCFNADNTHLLLALSEFVFIIDLDAQDNNTHPIQLDWEVTDAVCSPQFTQQFTVTGSINETAFLVKYNFDILSGEITPIHQYDMSQNLPLTSIVYSHDSHFLYAVGEKANTVSQFNTITYEQVDREFQTLSPTGTLNKIRASSNGDTFATVNQNKVFTFMKSDNDTFEASTAQQFETGVPSVALSSSGGNLFIIDKSLQGDIKGQCDINTFYNPNQNSCSDCDSTCNLCVNSANSCFKCSPTYFLVGKTCQECVDRCEVCSNANSCQKCLQPFTVRSQVCGCPDGEFVFGGICAICSDNCKTCSSANSCSACDEGFSIDGGLCSKDGMETWLIILLVGIGLVVVAAISFVVVKKIRSKRNSPLLEENDSGHQI